MTDVWSWRAIVIVSAVVLGIQAAAMYWLGQRYGRRAAPSDWSPVRKRTGLWSLILSWTFLAGVTGHGGAVSIALPAWLVLGSQIWYLELGAWFSPYGGVPPAFLSIACSLCAYVIGVMRGLARSTTAHGSSPSGSVLR